MDHVVRDRHVHGGRLVGRGSRHGGRGRVHRAVYHSHQKSLSPVADCFRNRDYRFSAVRRCGRANDCDCANGVAHGDRGSVSGYGCGCVSGVILPCAHFGSGRGFENVNANANG